MTDDHDLVLVVDFGAQYAQLIARRVREARVYSEIVPHTMPVADMLAKRPKAIILSGGPSSVYDDGAPAIDGAIFTAGTPVFGMCYGFQLMAQGLGGTVSATGARFMTEVALKGIGPLCRAAGLIGHLTEEAERPIGFILSGAAAKAIEYDGPEPA